MSRVIRGIAMIVLALAPGLAQAQKVGKPFSLGDIEDLVRGGVDPVRIHQYVKDACLDFQLNSVTRTRLQAAGATASHFSSLEGVCVRQAPTPRVASSITAPQPPPEEEPPPSPAPDSPSSRAAEFLFGARLEVQMGGTNAPPRSFLTLDVMTQSLNGWRIGIGAAGAMVSQENSSTSALVRVDGRISVAISELPDPLALQVYATLGTLFKTDAVVPGFRISTGLAMSMKTPVRFHVDLAQEWHPGNFPFETQSTLLSFGVGWIFFGAEQ